MVNVLVVEDDSKLNKLYCAVLVRHNYRTFPAENGNEALEILDRVHIDVMISDIMMPNMDGYELTKMLREAGYNFPVLLVTAKGQFEDKQKGYSMGIDDYMVKPIDVNEMVLRVEALLRRAKIANDHKIEFGETLLDFDSMTVACGGKETQLPQKEFQLIYKLLSYPSKIFTRQQLMDDIWGMDSETDERTVDVHINRLRDRFKICEDFQIVTVRGLGYKAVKRVVEMEE